MIAHLNVIKGLLEAQGVTVYLMDKIARDEDATTYPYVVLSPGYGRAGERPLGGRLDSIDQDLQVRWVGATAASMLGLLRVGRKVLAPGQGPLRLVGPGWRATLRFLRHEVADVDRDVTITELGTHPHFGVDAFHLVSTPTRLPEEG